MGNSILAFVVPVMLAVILYLGVFSVLSTILLNPQGCFRKRERPSLGSEGRSRCR